MSRDDLNPAAALAGVCFLLSFCSVLRAAEPPRVVVFGDSIARIWVHDAQQHAAGRLRFVDESRVGRPTDAADEFAQMLQRNGNARLDLLVVALGTNDSGDLSTTAVPRAAANLRRLVRAARSAAGSKLEILIVGPPNMSEAALAQPRPTADRRVRQLQELNRAFAELARVLRCRFVSLYGVLPEASLARDGMHPDAAGNQIIARALMPVMLDAIRR